MQILIELNYQIKKTQPKQKEKKKKKKLLNFPAYPITVMISSKRGTKLAALINKPNKEMCQFFSVLLVSFYQLSLIKQTNPSCLESSD